MDYRYIAGYHRILKMIDSCYSMGPFDRSEEVITAMRDFILSYGRPLPHNHRQKTFPNGTLVIEDLQRSRDGGQYHCVAENNRSRTARRDLLLLLNPFRSRPRYRKASGPPSLASCPQGSSHPHLLDEGWPTLPDDLWGSISTVNEFTSTLSFSSVSQIHNGNYTCIASNPVASRNHTATMIVKVPPKWRTEPSDKSVVMGQPVMFDCQANGYPIPLYAGKKSSGIPHF
ncbi:down syndrome cell adhesion molecule-like protein Dscam2 [Caerostris extrusa]|uniref:Down syndrome cell adhesion molecule-like protein Dscam2 n=1 Tax=Caerostris extrusa TaxID=172846 RepID=A0AAV4M4Q6_CAEEX|nr:down syndrome cell adhesion molecule-like protein Dscam2 [Caerostris extrusa]